MEKDVLVQILHAYGISGYRLLPAQKGYRNYAYPVVTASQTLNLMLYKREPGIAARVQRANAVGDFLAEKGLPARRTYDKRILKVQAGTGTRYVALYDYLPGKTIPWEAYTMEHLKTLGHTMAHMHQLLLTYKGAELPAVEQECLSLEARMQAYFAQTGVKKALKLKLHLELQPFNFKEQFETPQTASDRQALHMDFVRSNILFEGKKISGILDFEKAAYGSPVFDIARTLAFLLVDCKYKDESKVRKYFLQSGYIKRGACNLENVPPSVLEALVTFYLLHDFYKFLLHNPYEYLALNEHFSRTKALLLKHGLIVEV